MACVCGHAIEEHEDEIGSCEGQVTVQNGRGGRKEQPCDCLGYEDDDDDESEEDEA
jgi:hypothetical protein